ncbi:MAG: superoxide dismutase [bacterium]|nr:superoxide dismutase [bacterium]
MFELPDLPYAYSALEPFIDEETMRVHLNGHHATYVKNLNEALAGHEEFLKMGLEELLKSLDKVPEEIRTKVKNNAGGHYHHSIFWTMMASPGNSKPHGKLLETINQTFGNLEAFKEQFNYSVLGVFGSGWTWLVLDNGKLSILNTPNQDSPISQGLSPILGLDLWEHAYYLKYKNKRADYIEAWWNVVNWGEAENHFLKSSIS